MFGYIECNRSKLSKEELERYQSVYCGLCRNLREIWRNGKAQSEL